MRASERVQRAGIEFCFLCLGSVGWGICGVLIVIVRWGMGWGGMGWGALWF